MEIIHVVNKIVLVPCLSGIEWSYFQLKETKGKANSIWSMEEFFTKNSHVKVIYGNKPP